jgi:hypothetical protein
VSGRAFRASLALACAAGLVLAGASGQRRLDDDREAVRKEAERHELGLSRRLLNGSQGMFTLKVVKFRGESRKGVVFDVVQLGGDSGCRLRVRDEHDALGLYARTPLLDEPLQEHECEWIMQRERERVNTIPLLREEPAPEQL